MVAGSMRLIKRDLKRCHSVVTDSSSECFISKDVALNAVLLCTCHRNTPHIHQLEIQYAANGFLCQNTRMRMIEDIAIYRLQM